MARVNERPRVAWVTGASGSLGRAVVARLARDGWAGVASGGRRPPDGLPASWHGMASALDDPTAARAAAMAAVSRWGRLDLAVLAAGGWEGGSGLAGPAGDGLLERLWRINTETAWHSARAAAAAMAGGAAAPGPRAIVLVAAFGALAVPAGAGQAAYRASKAAIASLADALTSDLGAQGIGVFAVAPTTLDTAANREAMPGADRSSWVSVDDLADLVAFLATPAAALLAGSVLPASRRVQFDHT